MKATCLGMGPAWKTGEQHREPSPCSHGRGTQVYAAFLILELKSLFTDTNNLNEKKRLQRFPPQRGVFLSTDLTGPHKGSTISLKERIFLELVSFCSNTQFPSTQFQYSIPSTPNMRISVLSSFPCPAFISKGTNPFWQALPAVHLQAKPKSSPTLGCSLGMHIQCQH